MAAIEATLAVRTRSPQTGAGADTNLHVVVHGDTLSTIAARAGVSLRALIAANPQIANPDRIYPGDRIEVPQGEARTEGTTGVMAGGSAAASLSLSAQGLDLVKRFEGLRLGAYQDAAGVWTIGYGHTGNVHPGQRITEAHAEQLLRKDVAWAEDAVRKNVDVPLSQGQFDALVSFTFNLGAGALQRSTLLQKLNAGDYAGAQAEFGRFVHAGGRVLPGLVRRRADEAELFGNSAPAGAPSNGRPAGSGDVPAARLYTVRSGDTLWDIAQRHGVSLSALIAANPQIQNPNRIYPGQHVHLPAEATGARGAGAVDATGPAASVNGNHAAAIAQQFLGQNASSLKRSGALPMNPNVPSDVCCANFVSACLQKAGLLPNSQHTDSVATLGSTLRGRGWQPVSMANAKPGDVVIIQGGGVSHTVMVLSNDNGRITTIGSNNRNADGTQRITTDSSNWAWQHGAVILAPPRR